MIIQCDECSKKLKVPENAAGKKAKCPGCGSTIRIPAETASTSAPDSGAPSEKKSAPSTPVKKTATRSASASSVPAKKRPTASAGPARKKKKKRPAEPTDDLWGGVEDDPYGDPFSGGDLGSYGDAYDDDDEFDEGPNPYAAPKAKSTSRKRGKGGGRSDALRLTGTGMLISAWGYTAIFFAALFMAIAAGLGGAMNVQGGGGATAVLGLVIIGLVLVALAGGLANIVGQFMCLSAPSSTGGKGLIIASLSCWTVGVILNVVAELGEVPILGLLASVFALVAFVTMELFLRTIASYLRRDDLARRAMIILVGAIVVGVLFVVGSVVMVAMAMGGGGGVVAVLFLVFMLVLLVAALVFLVMHVSLLFQLGKECRS